MAFTPGRPRAHNERGLARMRRSSQVDVSSVESDTFTPTATVGSVQTSSSSAAHQAVNTNLPTSVKALTGFIVVLGVIILGIAIWKIRVWRIRKQKSGIFNSQCSTNEQGTYGEKMSGTYGITPSSIDLESARVEKPSKAYIPSAVPSTPRSGWVPQIRPDLAPPEPTKPRAQQAKKTWEKNLAELMDPNSNSSSPHNPTSPPPSYCIANQSTPVSRDNFPVPPTPVNPPSQALPPTPPAVPKLTFEGIAPPSKTSTPGPARNSSFAPHPIVRLSNSSRYSEKKFPRLMSVVDSFDPSMVDELLITVGETVRILEEYEDEWCLVQRVGRIDSEKGVVPRLCLTERSEIVPTHPGLPSAGSYRR
jgi:hypothetical protein